MDWNNSNQNAAQDYTQTGFNVFMERSPQSYLANQMLDGYTSPFIEQVSQNGYTFDPFSDTTSQTTQSMLQPISGDQIQGGVIQSNNGNLQLDLNNNILTYNDGITNLLNVGGSNSQGTPNSLTINNLAGNPIVSS